MGQGNTKYTTVGKIYANLTRLYKSKSIDFNDIVEWCAQAELEIIGGDTYFARYYNFPITVSNYQAILPCNLYRLKDVFTEGRSNIKDYYNTGTHLNFNSDFSDTTIYINYWGIPMCDKGYPMILRGHELACEAYCLHNLLYEDFLNGKIDVNRWSVIQNNKIHQLEAANTGFRHVSTRDLDSINMIVHNMVSKADATPFEDEDTLG